MSSSNYIVTFKRDTPDDVIEKEVKKVEDSGCTIKHRYNAAIKGFAFNAPDEQVSTLSFQGDHFQGVEADGQVTTQGQALLG